MNGISPFLFRKLTPEQEKRGEKEAMVVAFIVVVVVAFVFVFLMSL